MMERFQAWRDWSTARSELRGRFDDSSLDYLGDACAFAEEWHGTQTRPGGQPYLWHLLEAMEIAVKLADVADREILAVALLHDVVEDTPCTLKEVEARFGDRVAGLVDWLTKPDTASGETKATYLERFLHAPWEARIVKLADRYSNVQCLETHPNPAKQRSYYAETCRYFMPVAESIPAFAAPYARWRDEYVYLATDV